MFDPSSSPSQTQEEILSALFNTHTKRLQIKKRLQKENEKAHKNTKESSTVHNLEESKEQTYEEEDSSTLIAKRVRKNRDQIKALQKAHDKCGRDWTKSELKKLAQQLGLSIQQVYKWSWDQVQKKKKGDDQRSEAKTSQVTDEFGGYSKSWFIKGGSMAIQEKDTT